MFQSHRVMLDPDFLARAKRWASTAGYASVDEFVARTERAVGFRDGSVRSEDVEQVRFAPVRWRTGYDMDAVDTHLEQLASQLTDIES